MAKADFLISTELLRIALEFPEGVTIVGRPDGNLRLTVESDLIMEGVTEVLPVWKKDGDVVTFLHFEACNLPACRSEETGDEVGAIAARLMKHADPDVRALAASALTQRPDRAD